MILEKGYFDTLEAIALLHSKGTRLIATFAGQWLNESDRQAFNRFVTENNLANVVNHIGKVTERDRIKTLQLNADVFVLPSYLMEGQPLTIIEALNAGSPIITTRLGGMVDMIEEGKEGFFIAAKDSEAIALAISKLLVPSVWHKMSVAARQRYNETYSASRIAGYWKNLVERVE